MASQQAAAAKQDCGIATRNGFRKFIARLFLIHTNSFSGGGEVDWMGFTGWVDKQVYLSLASDK